MTYTVTAIDVGCDCCSYVTIGVFDEYPTRYAGDPNIIIDKDDDE